jgi:hypothetical protein
MNQPVMNFRPFVVALALTVSEVLTVAPEAGDETLTETAAEAGTIRNRTSRLGSSERMRFSAVEF